MVIPKKQNLCWWSYCKEKTFNENIETDCRRIKRWLLNVLDL